MPYPDPFRAVILENTDGNVHASVKQLPASSLPDGDVLVSVAYSSLNYKDALAVTNRGKIVRRFPMVPGIDFSGTVVESKSNRFKPGDKVVLTGWGAGEDHWGGLAQLARVKADWLLALPEGLTLKRAMSIGTAGLTAMFCVMVLEEHGVRPDKGDVVVTGATGGVGCIAVMLLAGLGYRVVASTGKSDAHEFLKSLGAREIVDRHAFAGRGDKPLESGRWAGAVDTVGGETLSGNAATDEPRRLRGGGRIGGWRGTPHHGLPVHPAGREPGRHLIRLHANRTAACGLGAVGACVTDGNP